MNINTLVTASVTLLAILADETRGTTRAERTLSPSGEFVIYGGDAGLRASISGLAEQTKSNLLATLERRDSWQVPVVVNLQMPEVNLPEVPSTTFRLSQTGSGLKLQLDLLISSMSDHAMIEREICRAILLEMIYRNKNSLASETIYVEPPQWLIEGLLAAAPTSERAELIEALIVATNVPPLDDFLRQGAELFDSAGRLLHRAHSLALVQLLIGLPGGRDSLYRYIENLATASNDPSRDLRATFAQLAGGNAESLWKSQISQLSVSGNHQLLSFARTEAKLAELLRGQLKDFSQRKLSRSEQLSLQRLNQELLLLAVRANPVCRALIQQYQQIALELAAGKNRGTSARLAGLNNSRARISARIREIDDYMNWFEAAKLETSSRLFDGYLKAAEESAASTSRRKDALSVYLDAMEQEF